MATIPCYAIKNDKDVGIVQFFKAVIETYRKHKNQELGKERKSHHSYPEKFYQIVPTCKSK